MIINKIIREIVKQGTLIWNKHALERMMKRGITRETVINILLNGEIIENYTDDKPYPRCLLFGKFDDEPYHVVAAFHTEAKQFSLLLLINPI